MKIVDYLLTVLTAALLSVNQVFLKLWLEKYRSSLIPIKLNSFALLFKYELVLSVISFLVSIVIWLNLLNRINFSILYPMISLSYIFGMFAAKYIFHEEIPTIRWVGVIVIVIGVVLIAKK
jgi:drug/metabolite transporter (DMT)-like permease